MPICAQCQFFLNIFCFFWSERKTNISARAYWSYKIVLSNRQYLHMFSKCAIAFNYPMLIYVCKYIVTTRWYSLFLSFNTVFARSTNIHLACLDAHANDTTNHLHHMRMESIDELNRIEYKHQLCESKRLPNSNTQISVKFVNHFRQVLVFQSHSI